MARLVTREFDKTKPTFARRAFTANGHRFEHGDHFNWRKMAVSVRRAAQMFDAGLLMHEAGAVAQPMNVVTEGAEPVDYDNLDLIDDMKELRRIADEVGAPYKVSKADQRQAIRDHRNKETD